MRDFLIQNQVAVMVILWTLPWKATALWKAARRKELGWFIAILLINTLGILEMFYIFVMSKRENKENNPEKSIESKSE